MSYSRFLAGKAVSLAVTVVLALSATVMIAGYGGAIDKIMMKGIEISVREAMAKEPSFRGLTAEKREEVYKRLVEEAKRNLGLNRPFLERASAYILKTLALDLGEAWFLSSDAGSRRVMDIILERLPRTVLLFTTGALVSMLIGIPVGVRMARRALSSFDRGMTALALVSNALPLWWTGMLMIIILSFYFRILPAGGFVSVPPPKDPILYALDVLYHMLLPLLTIVLVSFGSYAYVVRNMVLRVFQEDYIMAERARGLPEKLVTYRHALRAASPPIATLIGFSLLASTGGAIISEVVFNWPGMGRLYWDAISQQDLPVVIGLTYFSIILYALMIMLLEIIYGILDPRVRVTPGAR